jgi:hypothetical protein
VGEDSDGLGGFGGDFASKAEATPKKKNMKDTKQRQRYIPTIPTPPLATEVKQKKDLGRQSQSAGSGVRRGQPMGTTQHYPQQPGMQMPQGHMMRGPGPGHPIQQGMQMRPGVSGPNAPISQAGPMMVGMPPYVGPNAHALSHLQQQQQHTSECPLSVPKDTY